MTVPGCSRAHTYHLLPFPPLCGDFSWRTRVLSCPPQEPGARHHARPLEWTDRHALTLAFCFSACSWASISSGLVYCLTRPLWPPFLPAQRTQVREGEREGCPAWDKGDLTHPPQVPPKPSVLKGQKQRLMTLAQITRSRFLTRPEVRKEDGV